MKNFLFLISSFLGQLCFAAQMNASISLEDLVRAPKFYNVVISPDGRFLASVVNPGDDKFPFKRALQIFDLQAKKEVAYLNYPGFYSVESAQWVNDERLMLRGSKKYRKYSDAVTDPDIMAVNWDGSKQLTIFGPSAGKVNLDTGGVIRHSAGKEEYASFQFIRELPDTPEYVLGVKTPWTRGVDGDWSTFIVKLNVYNGAQLTLEKLPFKRAQVLLDYSGRTRYVQTTDDLLQNHLYYRSKDDNQFKLVESYFGSQGGWWPVGFDGRNEMVIIESNVETPFTSLYRLDLNTNQRELIVHDPLGDVDTSLWSVSGHEFLGYRTASAIPELTVTNSTHKQGLALAKLKLAFPGKQIAVSSTTRDANKVIGRVFSDVDPGLYVLLDMVSGQAQSLGTNFPWLKGKTLAPMNFVSFKARDGLNIPGYLTFPVKKTDEKFPLVLLVHGGPFHLRDDWGYSQDVQILASRGYAVLQVNFRGSSGYGRDFAYGAYGKWGTTMQDDLIDAVRWAAKEKQIDVRRVCIMGHSYGGYAAVWGAMRDSTEFKCAIGSMGVYDLPFLFEEGDVAHRKYAIPYLKQILGEDKEALAKLSPVNFAHQLKIPLLLSHGEQDNIATIDHAEKLKKALKRASKDYEWIEFDDEGHSLASEKNQIRFYSAILDFLDRNIGPVK